MFTFGLISATIGIAVVATAVYSFFWRIDRRTTWIDEVIGDLEMRRARITDVTQTLYEAACEMSSAAEDTAVKEQQDFICSTSACVIVMIDSLLWDLRDLSPVTYGFELLVRIEHWRLTIWEQRLFSDMGRAARSENVMSFSTAPMSAYRHARDVNYRIQNLRADWCICD